MTSWFSAKSRITFGLVCLLVSVLSTAMMIGAVPDDKMAVREGRARLCETVAVASSDYISRGDFERLNFLLNVVAERNKDVVSVGVRRSDGVLLTAIGDHSALWEIDDIETSTDTHVHVPVRSGSDKWGNIEILFRPMEKPGIVGWLESPWFLLIGFVSAASYLLFLFYLNKMLAHLDPSKSVPKRVRSALDSLAEGLLVVDTNGRIVLANQSISAWLKRDPEKLVGVNAGSLGWMKSETGELIEEYPWVEALRTEKPQAGVMLGLKRTDGQTQALIANASPVLGHDGKYRGVLVSFDDVTQLEETRKELGVAKQAADEANQAKSEFLARMSHEIRTPMNAILGYTDVLRRGFDDDVNDRQEYLNTISASGEHLLALINDILDLSKIEAGSVELELNRCSPHQILQHATSVLRVKAQEKGITLETKFEGFIPETILTDSVRLNQTVINLIGNAIKFTQTGGVTVAVRSLADEKLRIDVIDTGIGMAPSVLEKIFDPFAQADSSVTRRFGGTGLGLAVSKQLAEALGGEVSVTSQEGKGSTFTLVISTGPLEGIAMITADQAAAAMSQVAASNNKVLQLPPCKILAVDDGDSNRKLIKLVLERAGVNVALATNGQEAVDLALAEHFDIILLDMQMPIMDGYTAATVMRQAGLQQPIIAMTAHAMRGDEEKCRAAGCSGFMTKPIKIDLLLSTLNELLGGAANSFESETAVAEVRDDTDAENNAHEPATKQVEAKPIVCSFPLDDPDFLEIAEQFVGRLRQQIAVMKAAHEAGDFAQLAQLAHWLKGSGGTAGFNDFTKPAIDFEHAAKRSDADGCRRSINELGDMLGRIQLPAAAV